MRLAVSSCQAMGLQVFEAEGCRMVEMSCEDHDRIAASTQFMTHTVGRVLGSMDLAPTAIDTRGFQSLLSLVDNTTHDSFDLYYGLFMYNAVRAPGALRRSQSLHQTSASGRDPPTTTPRS